MSDYKKYFVQVVEQLYPNQSSLLLNNINDRYKLIAVDTNFSKTSGNPIDKRLDFCAYFLALIKVLDERGENFETIRKVCLSVITEYVRPKNNFQQLLKKLPPILINVWPASLLLKVFNKKVSHNDNPNGFIANIITDKAETYGFGYGVDILECGICKLFKKHHYEKYSSILCEVDEITSGLAGLKLIRTGTIANGAKKCDFRFMRDTTK